MKIIRYLGTDGQIGIGLNYRRHAAETNAPPP